MQTWVGGELCYVEFQQVVMFANSGFAQSRSGRCWAGLGWRWRSGEYELWDVSCLMLGILGSWVDHFSVVSVDLVGCCHDMSALPFVKRMRLKMTKLSQVSICREARQS